MKTGMGGLCGVPLERRWATNAIHLHAPDIKRTPERILFPGNKKVRFLTNPIFFNDWWTLADINGRAGACGSQTAAEPTCLKTEIRPQSANIYKLFY